MPAGLQIWDAAGSLILETSTRVGTLVGHIDTLAVNGLITVPATLMGEPLLFVKQMTFPRDYVYIFPSISISGGTLRWVYPPPFNPYQTNVSVRIFYGFF